MLTPSLFGPGFVLGNLVLEMVELDENRHEMVAALDEFTSQQYPSSLLGLLGEKSRAPGVLFASSLGQSRVPLDNT